MSEAELFTELTNLVDVDPFALLGISLSADEKRIAKRYRQIAKQLHPDAIAGLEGVQCLAPATAVQVIARIVNPAYQKLKHEKKRQEPLATLRLRVRRLVRIEKLVPTFQSAQQLADIADSEVDTFYEQALTQLAENQFRSLKALHTNSLEIGQLNLIFLRRKMEEPIIRPKRAGLMTHAVTPTAANRASFENSPTGSSALAKSHSNRQSANGATQEAPEMNYAQQYTARAKAYLVKQNYEMAVQELREALKIDPQSPELHSMIGQVYYKQKLSGMAKTHFRQALKLKPTHQVAQKYGKLLGLLDNVQGCYPISKNSDPPKSETGPQKLWLGRLLKR